MRADEPILNMLSLLLAIKQNQLISASDALPEILGD
jgi:hypothetical protein